MKLTQVAKPKHRRRLFIKLGCPHCAEIMAAVHQFNASVTSERRIDVVWDPTKKPRWINFLKKINPEQVEYPTLIFDGICIIGAENRKNYYEMLKELNSLEGGE